MRKKLRINRGITLIALVITIIVLLILAGVSISMLTGQNGILTQVKNAKNSTEQSGAKEKLELAVIGAIGQSQDGKVTIDNLKTEISNYGGSLEKNEFPTLANIDNNKFLVKSDGSVLRYKEMSEITGQETENTSTKDSLGNYIVVPSGFKIINSTENVSDGIVIEDVSHEATAESQFVWIPVGEVITGIKDGVKNTETIELKRYVFNTDGSINIELSKIEPGQQLKTSSSSSYYFTEELKDSTTPNTHAKDIEIFKLNATNNHGYYIGRYEARKNGEQLTVKANDTVYNNTTQPEAAILSREMYSDSNFKSDLVNSYAWDTTVLFLQKFDNRTNKESLKPYVMQNSLNNSLASQGTNNLTDTSKKDVICNVWDMASNCAEWTTETCSETNLYCTARGGICNNSGYCTGLRDYHSTRYIDSNFSFRLLLYI